MAATAIMRATCEQQDAVWALSKQSSLALFVRLSCIPGGASCHSGVKSRNHLQNSTSESYDSTDGKLVNLLNIHRKLFS
jgi:hypothetical protein